MIGKSQTYNNGLYTPEQETFSMNELRIVATRDEYTTTGKQLEIFKDYGMTAEGLSDTAIKLLEQK